MANDDESFNKEMASDSLEWHVIVSKQENQSCIVGQQD